MEEKQGEQGRVERGTRQSSSLDSVRGSVRAQMESGRIFCVTSSLCQWWKAPFAGSAFCAHQIFHLQTVSPGLSFDNKGWTKKLSLEYLFQFLFLCYQAHCTCHDPCNFNKDFPEYLLLRKVVFGVSGHSMSQWLNPGCYSFAKQSLCVIIWILRLSSLH